MTKRCLFLSLLCTVLPLAAQDAAQTSERLQQDIQRQDFLRRLQYMQDARKNKQQPINVSAGSEAEEPLTAEDYVPVLRVKTLEIQRGSVLPQELTDELKRRYENRKLSVAELKAIPAALNDWYKKNGYITSRAYLPEQDAGNGTLRVNTFEGTIGKITATGMNFTKESYVVRGSRLNSGELFCVNSIEEKLAAFNAVGDLKARLNISPGDASGTSDLELVVRENRRVSGLLFSDNAGVYTTGYVRCGLFATFRGLLRTAYTRDFVTAGYVGSRGSDAVSASYTLTENTYGTTWNIGVDHSDTDIKKGELQDLHIEGAYSSVNASVRHALYSRENTLLSHGLTLLFKKNESQMLSSYTIKRYRTNTLGYTVELLKTFERGYLYNTVCLSRGWQLLDESRYFWRGTYRAEGRYNVTEWVGFNARLNAQMSSLHEMQSSEQMQMGGVNSVRGYEEGLLNGERGICLQTEACFNLKSLCSKIPACVRTAEAFVFYDCGKMVHKGKDQTLSRYNESYLVSAGCGVRFGITDYFSLSGTMAIPLQQHPLNRESNKPHWLYAATLSF